MNTRKLEESASLVRTVSWSAIASGAFIALALQTVLLLLGLGVATSVGRAPGVGFGTWMVIVELCSIAIGAALTARLSRADRRMGGVAAGIMTWSVVVVFGAVFQGLTMTRPLGGSGAWSAFIGAIVSLVAAVIGGSFGARLGRSFRGSELAPSSRDYDAPTSGPMAPVH